MFNLFLPLVELDFVILDDCVVRITEMCHLFFSVPFVLLIQTGHHFLSVTFLWP